MKKIRGEALHMNMTPMIDVVFQLIIFFVTTAVMQNKALEMEIRMAMAPHGQAVQKKDPRTINVDVDSAGRIYITRSRIPTEAMLTTILRKAVAESGQTLPVVIRGDAQTPHEYIRKVMDACSAAGLWKIKFAAIKEKATTGGS